MTRLIIAFALSLVIALAAHATPSAPVVTGSYEDTVPVEDALGPDWRPYFSDAFALGEDMEFKLYVPKTYDPSQPAGILTYISPSRSGAIPNGWKKIVATRNLIWVSVNNSGNDQTVQRRMAETLAATDYVRNHYRTDETRTYVAGFSGGGRLASMMAYYFANLFDGALYICGANAFPEEDPTVLDLMRSNRFVFLTGTQDFNEADTKAVFAHYKAAHMKGSRMLVVHNLHHELPGRRDFDRAMDWLDQRP